MNLSATSLILLSAGQGSRVGGSKGLYPYRGRPWILWQLERVRELGLAATVVVLGYQQEKYPDLPDVKTVVNPAPERGPFSSIVSGLSSTSGPVFVLPVDVPCPQPETWNALARALIGDVQAAVPTVGGHGGHPVLLAASYAATLRQCDPATARLDHQLKKLPSAAFASVAVCDPRAVTDLNTPDDWDNA